MKRFLRYIAAPGASAVLLACAFPPLHLYWLAWFALVPLLWDCADRAPRDCAGRFLLAGWLFHALLLNWLAANVFWAGLRALLGWQLLSLYLGLYWGALGWVYAWLRGRLPKCGLRFPFEAGLLLPFLWVVMERAQARLLTGFGWSALGYSQADNQPFALLAAVGGVGLLGFLLVLINTWLTQLARREWYALPKALLLFAVVLGVSAPLTVNLLTKETSATRVAIYQASFPQSMKWDADYHLEMVRRSAADSLVMAEAERPDLIVWPEALVMRDYRTPEYFDLVKETAVGSGAYLFTGTTRRGDGGEDYNSSVLLDPAGNVVDTYDKMHLAPFGEYVPLSSYWPALEGLTPGGAMDAGTEAKVLEAGTLRLGPLICFEVLFADMAARLRAEGADALVVVTNLAWFGHSAAAAQELEIARLRAIETGLPLVHAANTGISAVIWPSGTVFGPNALVGGDGQYYRFRGEGPPPASTLMQRMLAVHMVPPPRREPALHISAGALAWGCLAVCVLAAVTALWRKPAEP